MGRIGVWKGRARELAAGLLPASRPDAVIQVRALQLL
jgi:hypothetical protein